MSSSALKIIRKKYNKCKLLIPTDTVFNEKIRCDYEVMKDSLSRWKNNEGNLKLPLVVKNDRLQYAKYGASARTCIQAMDNGHYDTDVWQLVNYHKNDVYKNHSGNNRSKIVPHGYASQFVIDLDQSGFYSLDDLENYLTANNKPMPIVMTQTSINCFHLTYRMVTDCSPTKGLVNTEVMLFASWLFGIDIAACEDILVLLKELSDIGVDRQYLKQAPATHKFRVPGTMKIKDSSRFLCKGRYYPKGEVISQSFIREYGKSVATFESTIHRAVDPKVIDLVQLIPIKPHTPERLSLAQEIELIDQVVPEIEPPVIFEKNQYWQEHVLEFTEEFAKVLPKRYAKRYAEWICNNLTFLKRGELFISQLRIARELDITQTTVSKHLRLLTEGGYLIITAPYLKKQTPKKYGIGAKLQRFGYSEKIVDKLMEEYSPGETNAQMLEDVRILVNAGVDSDKVVDFIHIKMYKKVGRKARNKNDIQNVVRNWCQKSHFVVPDKPRIDMDVLFSKLG